MIDDVLTAPADLQADTSWRARAACRLCPPELFFPSGTTGIALERMERAKQLCEDCEVQPEYLRFALETRQEFGIWGGTDEKERARLRRKGRMAALVGPMPTRR